MVMFILSTHAPLAFEASKFEFSKGETLECRYARPFLLPLYRKPSGSRSSSLNNASLNRDHAPHLGSQAVKTSKARLENSTDVDFMRA